MYLNHKGKNFFHGKTKTGRCNGENAVLKSVVFACFFKLRMGNKSSKPKIMYGFLCSIKKAQTTMYLNHKGKTSIHGKKNGRCNGKNAVL